MRSKILTLAGSKSFIRPILTRPLNLVGANPTINIGSTVTVPAFCADSVRVVVLDKPAIHRHSFAN
jgi:hypothetical protein